MSDDHGDWFVSLSTTVLHLVMGVVMDSDTAKYSSVILFFTMNSSTASRGMEQSSHRLALQGNLHVISVSTT